MPFPWKVLIQEDSICCRNRWIAALSSPERSPGAFHLSKLLQNQRSPCFQGPGSYQSALSRSSALWLLLGWTEVFERHLAPRSCSPMQAPGCLTLQEACPSSWCQDRNRGQTLGFIPILPWKKALKFFWDFHLRGKINTSAINRQIKMVFSERVLFLRLTTSALV